MDKLVAMRSFVAIVDHGSLTAAAAALDRSLPTMVRTLAALEEGLGTRLLRRTTRRMSLTAEGQGYVERCRRILGDIEEAEAEVSRLQEKPRGVLRINSPMSFGILHIAPALPEFLAQHPEVSVEMNLDDRVVDVIEEGFDVSIRIAEMPDSSLIARRLAPCRHVIVAAPAYLEKHGTPRTPEDLRDHNIISFSYQASAYDWHFISPDNKQVSVPVSGSMQANNSLALREALLRGVGITRTPTFVVGKDVQDGHLLSILGNYRTLEVSIYLVYPQRRHLSPKVRAFVDFMADRISEPPYWDTAAS